ncbi:MAG: hypothetical protein MN733_20115 [Nitrososphaera sp.]|nr:hypothetical protein [Nitrososphaera sp.]
MSLRFISRGLQLDFPGRYLVQFRATLHTLVSLGRRIQNLGAYGKTFLDVSCIRTNTLFLISLLTCRIVELGKQWHRDTKFILEPEACS